MKTHHVIKNGEQSGPYAIDEIQAMLASGDLASGDLYWVDGMSEWEPLGNAFEMPPASATPPPPPDSKTSATQAPPASSGLVAALKNLGGALLALAKMLFNTIKTAAQSDKAKQAQKAVLEKSSELRKRAAEMASAAASSEAVRAAAEKINKGAASIREKTHGTPATDGSTTPPATTPQPPPPSSSTQQEASAGPASENLRTRINWIPALVFFSITSVLLVIIDFFAIDSDAKAVFSFSIFALPFILLTVFFFSKLHYLCWKALPEEFRATTPGKAVGFMFIPFFNFYWAFVTLPKLSEGLSKWQQSAGKDTTNSKGLGITFAILFICHWVFAMLSIHVLGLMVHIALLVIFILYYRTLVKGFNQMLDTAPAQAAPQPTGFWSLKRIMIGVAVVVPLYWVILGVTYDPDGSPGGYDSDNYSYDDSYSPGWNSNQGSHQYRWETCSACGGSGKGTSRSPMLPCETCKGKRTITAGSGYEIVCPDCGGNGKRLSGCTACNGKGQVVR